MFFVFSLITIVHSTELTILKPSLLTPHGNNTIPVNVADFGYVPYGKTVSGDVVFINDTCNPINITVHGDVVLTEGTNCTFLAQAMNAQKAGAKMLIIIYNGREDISNFLLIADHSSQQVFIPSMMINGQDGDFLIEQLNLLNSTIIVSVEFHLHQNQQVNLEYYMSSLDNQSYGFLKQFQPFAEQMIKQITFTPTYVEYYCLECKQLNFTVTRQDCISGGRYCAFDPDQQGPLTGRDVILQDLTQLCILQEYNLTKWWNYAIVYSTMCLMESTQCSQKVMQLITINETRIQNCINTSFVGNDQLMDDNKILAAQREEVIKAQAIYWPTLYINGDFFKGDLFMINITKDDIFTVDQFAVLEAICDAFLDSDRPSLCNSSGFFTINDGELKQASNGWIMIAIWIGVGMLILFLLFASFLLYRRKLIKTVRSDVNVQVDTLLNEYYKMKDVK